MTNTLPHSTERVFRRARGIEIVSVPDGYVVYDDMRGLVHYLNPTAAIILELCEFCPDEASIARRVQALFSLSAPPRRRGGRLPCATAGPDAGSARLTGRSLAYPPLVDGAS